MDSLGYFFFQLISGYIDRQMRTDLSGAYGRVAAAVSFIAGALVLFSIATNGIKIAMGESREGMGVLVIKWAKMGLIAGIINTMAFHSIAIHDIIFGLRDDVIQTMTNETGNVFELIDNRLDAMSSSLSIIDAVDTSTDPSLAAEKSRALTYAIIGQASPPMIAGLLALINEIVLRIAITISPIFLLFLMFQKTQEMFFTWLKLIFSSFFSLAILTFVIGIAMNISAAFALILVGLQSIGGGVPELNRSLMQAGFGVILSTLLVVIPGVITRFFAGAAEPYIYNTFAGLSPATPMGMASNAGSSSSQSGGATGSLPPPSTTPMSSTPALPSSPVSDAQRHGNRGLAS